MSDADFDAPEPPKASPMRRPAARRTAAPTIEATANPSKTAVPEPRDSFEAAVNEGVRQLTEIEQKRATDVAEILEHNPAKVLQDPEALEAVLAQMQLELETFVPNTSTAKGRAAVASFAHKFAKSKTAIDEAGKVLNSSLREQIDAVDLVRRKVRAKFDEYRDQARKPLDDWEAVQDRRNELVASIEKKIGTRVGVLDTAADVKLLIDGLSALVIDEDVLGIETAEELETKRLETVNELVAVHERLRRSEEQAIELERVQAENKRLKDEQDAAAAAETARQQEEEARVANEARKAEEAAAASRQAIAAAEQAERDRSALALQKAELEGKQRTAAAEAKATIDTTREMFGSMAIEPLRALLSKIMSLDVQQATVGTEYLSIGDLKRQLVDDIDRRVRELEEQAALTARQEHRKTVNTEVRDAILLAAKVSKEQANSIVIAIRDGNVPHTKITY